MHINGEENQMNQVGLNLQCATAGLRSIPSTGGEQTKPNKTNHLAKHTLKIPTVSIYD